MDNYLAVLATQTGWYSAQQTLVSARLARLTNLVDRYRYLGGGWIERTGDTPRPAEDIGSIAPSSSAPWNFSASGERDRPAYPHADGYASRACNSYRRLSNPGGG